MTLTYVFLFEPTPAQQAIVQYSGVMPQPAGVQVNYLFSNVLGPPNTMTPNTFVPNYFAIVQAA
jgi:hypothetical protein